MLWGSLGYFTYLYMGDSLGLYPTDPNLFKPPAFSICTPHVKKKQTATPSGDLTYPLPKGVLSR